MVVAALASIVVLWVVWVGDERCMESKFTSTRFATERGFIPHGNDWTRLAAHVKLRQRVYYGDSQASGRMPFPSCCSAGADDREAAACFGTRCALLHTRVEDAVIGRDAVACYRDIIAVPDDEALTRSQAVADFQWPACEHAAAAPAALGAAAAAARLPHLQLLPQPLQADRFSKALIAPPSSTCACVLLDDVYREDDAIDADGAGLLAAAAAGRDVHVVIEERLPLPFLSRAHPHRLALAPCESLVLLLDHVALDHDVPNAMMMWMCEGMPPLMLVLDTPVLLLKALVQNTSPLLATTLPDYLLPSTGRALVSSPSGALWPSLLLNELMFTLELDALNAGLLTPTPTPDESGALEAEQPLPLLLLLLSTATPVASATPVARPSIVGGTTRVQTRGTAQHTIGLLGDERCMESKFTSTRFATERQEATASKAIN